MAGFFRKENATLIGMIAVGIMLIIGIALRWEYVSSEAAGSFKGLFRKADTTQVATPKP